MATFTCTFNPMPGTTTQIRTDIFHPFPKLPSEIRIEIFHFAHALAPSQTLRFHLLKSDLDYLRLLRKPCNDFPHIRCSPLPIPSLLHACHESREVALEYYTLGFDGGLSGRTLKMGKEDTDVETFTTCSHELASEQNGRSVYWQPDKDLVLVEEGRDETCGLEEGYAYIWGGATGIRFQHMNRIAIFYETFLNLGMGNGMWWDSIDELTLYDRGWWFDRGRGRAMEAVMGEVKRLLKRAGVRRSDGTEVQVRYVERVTSESLIRWMRAEGVALNNPLEDYGNEDLSDVADGGFWTG